MSHTSALTVRPSPIAGTWYPGHPARLQDMVDSFLSAPLAPPVEFKTSARGILSPHAGLRFSGGVAGKSMRFTWRMDVEIVVIVGPSHYPYPADLLSTGHSHYETPLGRVPVATDLLSKLEMQIPLRRVTHDSEHSIEIELPFLQRTLGNFELLPLAMLDQSVQTARRLGYALADILAGKKVLLVASSDLSHFYTDAEAHLLDQVVLDAVAAYQPEEVIRADDEGRGFACGRGAIAAVMVAAYQLGARQAQVVGYATSGDITGDHSRVVGYGAAVFA